MSTLIRPPPPKPGVSPIESVLELTSLSAIDPNLFTNTRPLWHPPGARGIYGGAVIAQCLSAAQKTVPPNFTVHSMHCYFVLAGNSEIPVVYHVEHVRQGKSFATRTVQARQRGQPIFTTTMSFVRENSGGAAAISHAATMAKVPDPVDDETVGDQSDSSSPFQCQRIHILNNESPRPQDKKTRQWIRARGTISSDGGFQAHVSALAYMSDSYFIGTVARVHKLWRYGGMMSEDRDAAPGEREAEGTVRDKSAASRAEALVGRPEIGMMVSLDHAIYFHEPRAFRADEWMFTEMESPWAGDGRGLVMQKIYTREGRLIATCTQEVCVAVACLDVVLSRRAVADTNLGSRAAEAGVAE